MWLAIITLIAGFIGGVVVQSSKPSTYGTITSIWSKILAGCKKLSDKFKKKK